MSRALACSVFVALGGVLGAAEPVPITWEQLDSSGPSARSRMGLALQETDGSSSSTERFAWLFGGLERVGTTSSELWRYEVATATWALQTPFGTAPPACRGCKLLAATETDLYLVMGESAAGTLLRTVHRLDLSGGVPGWSLVASTGPSARTDHAVALASSGSIVLFGGRTGTSSYANDAWVFDTGTSSWTALSPTGTPPSARSAHAAVAVTSSVIAVFGGRKADGSVVGDLHLLDLHANAWSSPAVSSATQPDGRRGHAALLVDRYLCVVHGLSGDGEQHEDVWLADAFGAISGEVSWTLGTAATAGDAPAGRWAHGAVSDGSRALVLGGMTGSTASSSSFELWAVAPRCSGTTLLSTATGSLSDGPGRYAGSLDCAWRIEPAEEHVVVQLFFLELGLADEYDRVHVHDGDTTGALRVVSATGSELPAPVTSSSGALVVRLETGSLGTGQGFRAAYRSVCAPGYARNGVGECKACTRGTFKAQAGDHGCSDCGARAYGPDFGARSCKACPRGSAAVSNTSSEAWDCACERGYYRAGGRCRVCEVGAACSGGSKRPVAREGWCRRPGTAGRPAFDHCCAAADCPGGSDEECSPAVATMPAEGPSDDPTPCATRLIAFETAPFLSLAYDAAAVGAAALLLLLAAAAVAGAIVGWKRAMAMMQARVIPLIEANRGKARYADPGRDEAHADADAVAVFETDMSPRVVSADSRGRVPPREAPTAGSRGGADLVVESLDAGAPAEVAAAADVSDDGAAAAASPVPHLHSAGAGGRALSELPSAGGERPHGERPLEEMTDEELAALLTQYPAVPEPQPYDYGVGGGSTYGGGGGGAFGYGSAISPGAYGVLPGPPLSTRADTDAGRGGAAARGSWRDEAAAVRENSDSDASRSGEGDGDSGSDDGAGGGDTRARDGALPAERSNPRGKGDRAGTEASPKERVKGRDRDKTVTGKGGADREPKSRSRDKADRSKDAAKEISTGASKSRDRDGAGKEASEKNRDHDRAASRTRDAKGKETASKYRGKPDEADAGDADSNSKEMAESAKAAKESRSRDKDRDKAGEQKRGAGTSKSSKSRPRE